MALQKHWNQYPPAYISLACAYPTKMVDSGVQGEAGKGKMTQAEERFAAQPAKSLKAMPKHIQDFIKQHPRQKKVADQ